MIYIKLHYVCNEKKTSKYSISKNSLAMDSEFLRSTGLNTNEEIIYEGKSSKTEERRMCPYM